MDMKPVTRILWYDEEDKSIWIPRIERIRKMYAKAEFSTFMLGMRRVYVYHINSKVFEKSYDFLRDNDLVFYPTNKSGVYQGFSHKHLPVEPGKPYTLYGGAAKREDKEAGELFKEYSEARPVNHKGIGNELLGYMECDTDFFDEVWPNVSIDPMYESALNTKDAVVADDGSVTLKCHPYCNNMLRYFSIRILPHIPHSMRCKPAIKWGKKWMTVMKRIDTKAAKWAVELLSMPLTWDAYKGVAIIDTPLFKGVTNSDTTPVKKVVKNLGWTKKL